MSAQRKPVDEEELVSNETGTAVALVDDPFNYVPKDEDCWAGKRFRGRNPPETQRPAGQAFTNLGPLR